MELWKDSYDVRTYETDARGELSLVYLVRYLQESAARHAESLNFARDRLVPLGLGWVLGRFHVRLAEGAKRPGWRDKVTVETWRSGFERLFALRDYRLLDAGGAVLAEATSHWAVIDLARRRPVPVPQFIVEAYPVDAPRALDSRFEKLPEADPASAGAVPERTIEARSSVIDVNDHVTNTAYINWILESVPGELARELRPCELEILFRAETLLGEKLVARGEVARTGDQAEVLHQLTRAADGRPAVQARTRWSRPAPVRT